jgi:CRP/FNR family transcriptional regulator, cyclic AMP receptor protein
VSNPPAETTVHVLDEDPALGRRLSERDLASARRFAVADVVSLQKGPHKPGERFEGEGLLGLLILEGLLVRQVAVAERRCGELVGPGAVLRPWDDFGQNAPLPFELSWRVIQPTRIAMLDRRFLATIIRWPALIEAFVERATERAQTLAFNVAIHCLQHVDVRLLVLMWHLADRFGRVTTAGTVVPLPLSHADLAELVGAARPSVSAALRELADKGLVQRSQTDRGWILTREPPTELRDMRRARTAA